MGGKQLPECTGYPVVETLVTLRVPGSGGEENAFVAVDLGYMRNRDRRTALGGQVRLMTESSGGPRFGLMARYRRWTGTRSSMDFLAGVYLGGKTEHYATELSGRPGLRFPAPVIEARLISRWFGMTAGADFFRRTSGAPSVEPYAGVTIGGWIPPVALLAFAAAIALTWD